mgnify:CR=1 FL=1
MAAKILVSACLLGQPVRSCGSSFSYSGALDGVRRAGQGVVTATLRASGIQVFGQHQIAALDRLIA